MSYHCDTHGWQHLFQPCPACGQLHITTGSTLTAPKKNNSMKSKEYQKWAVTLDRSYGELLVRLAQDPEKLRLVHMVMGLSGETGELVDSIKKHLMYGKDLDVVNVKEELGDICWYMANLLDGIGSSFEEVMELNRQKLNQRFPEGKFSEKLAQSRLDKKPTDT